MTKKRISADVSTDRKTPKEAPHRLDTCNFFGLRLDNDQQKLVDSVWKREYKMYLINSAAGSGKTLISTALGVKMYYYGFFDKIIYVTFPGIYEKSQGFLPGDLLEKSDPYFQPLYDALLTIDVLPSHVCNTSATVKEPFIECAVSTYMRGINLSKAFIIIDESENADLATLTKVLSRITDDCMVMLIGHSGQCDMYDKSQSGFTACIDYLQKKRPEFCKQFNLTQNHRGLISATADLLMKSCPKPSYGFVYMTVNGSTGDFYTGYHKRSMDMYDIDDKWFVGDEYELLKDLVRHDVRSFKRYILFDTNSKEQSEYYSSIIQNFRYEIGDNDFYNTIMHVLNDYQKDNICFHLFYRELSKVAEQKRTLEKQRNEEEALNSLKNALSEELVDAVKSFSSENTTATTEDTNINSDTFNNSDNNNHNKAFHILVKDTTNNIIEEYFTREDMVKAGYNIASVLRVCRGDRKTYKGFKFERLEK